MASLNWSSREVTCVAPINIAFIKYWGKRDETHILPLNDSYSITLDTNRFYTTTTIRCVSTLKAGVDDTMWLNGEKQDPNASKRIQNVFRDVRARLPAPHNSYGLQIVSENNFPTAAGMASSASGYCCLVFSLCTLFGIPIDQAATRIARVGSGSACRSLYGGFVKWLMGSPSVPDGSDSYAVQGVPAEHWPDLQILILVTKPTQKDVGSSEGMRRSVQTSASMKPRCDTIVPARMQAVHEALLRRDFPAFATIAMEDSDDLHSVCITSDPFIEYWTLQSYRVIAFVRAFNTLLLTTPAAEIQKWGGIGSASVGSIGCGYTYDAGPNTFVFTTRNHLPLLMTLVLRCFPGTADDRYHVPEDLLANAKKQAAGIPQSVIDFIRARMFTAETEIRSMWKAKGKDATEEVPEGFVHVFHSGVGSGPRILEVCETPGSGKASLMGADGTPPVKKSKTV